MRISYDAEKAKQIERRTTRNWPVRFCFVLLSCPISRDMFSRFALFALYLVPFDNNKSYDPDMRIISTIKENTDKTLVWQDEKEQT